MGHGHSNLQQRGGGDGGAGEARFHGGGAVSNGGWRHAGVTATWSDGMEAQGRRPEEQCGGTKSKGEATRISETHRSLTDDAENRWTKVPDQ